MCVCVLLMMMHPLRREEMDSLQKQMEEHTVTVHESMTSWANTEEELSNLGVHDNGPVAVTKEERDSDTEQEASLS